ncbi:MAG: gamma-glutamyltransferase [Clostridia bacterium]|nr:gamma-glutamyltransferase [Clostridia bacterium]
MTQGADGRRAFLDPARTSDPGRPVWSAEGLVAAPDPYAAASGLRALQAGGHAVDAALAMAAMTSLTMPEMCGPGGDAFALVYDAGTRRVTGFNGSGPAPEAATVQRFRGAGYETMPLTGWWSVAVPGAVGVWFELHRRYGRLALDFLWEPAVRLARRGVPMGARLAANIAQAAPLLARDRQAAAVFLRWGHHPRPTDLLQNPDLAETLETLLREGPEAITTGTLARRIAEASAEAGGLLTADDLARQAPDVYRPLVTTYRGYRVYETAPPSQGLILLEALNILEGFDLSSYAGPTDPEAVHLMVEIKKMAYADRNAYMGDPRFVRAPVEELISKSWATRRRQAFDPDRADNRPVAMAMAGDTTSFVAVDADGNAVSFIHSNSSAFGAGVMPPGTGMMMNNRAGRGFVLAEDHPNGLAPGKRTMHTLNTYLVTRATGDDDDGELVLAGNTPGGDGQPQWNLQVIVNVLDFGYDAYRAVAAPRWTSFPGTDPATLRSPLELRLESRFPPETAAVLLQKGHVVRGVGPWAGGGSAMLVVRRDDGVFEGAADPRDGGQALAAV